MRWRHMGINPVPIAPNEVETITLDLWSTAFVFDKGHSIRVAVSSSNYPRFLANPNTGLPLSMNQSGIAPIVAHNTLHLGWELSYLTLPVVKLSDLPRVVIV
jgi:predicted acyl esterase